MREPVATTPVPPPRPSFWRGKGARFLVVALLVLLMTIPLMMLGAITSERERYSFETIREIGGIWGAEQRITGPLLVVPAEREVVRTAGEGSTAYLETRLLVFSPETLDIEGDVTTQTRSRGIFDTTVFTARERLSGRFATPDAGPLLLSGETALWDRARIAVHVSDARAFEQNAMLRWNGREIAFEPGQAGGDGEIPVPRGYSIGRDIPAPTPRPGLLLADTGDPRAGDGSFAFDLAIRGSGRLHFAPLGRETTARITADWPHPSFDGAFLPAEHEINDSGFTATWTVPYLARGFPARWSAPSEGAALAAAMPAAFGVTFYQPVGFYQKVERALKYAVLFIGLTFLSIFLIELAIRRRTHAVQYLLVGMAQCVFFLLLLAFSEHIGFAAAYLGSASATILLLTAYVGLALRAGKGTWVAGAVLVTLYGFLYLLLESRDYALLIGAIAAFLSVAVTMAATRNVDWWADEEG